MAKTRKPDRVGSLALLAVVAALLVVAWWAGCQYFKHAPREGAATQTAELLSADRIILGGEPRATRKEASFQVLPNRAYVVGYSDARKNPVWAAYRLLRVATPFRLDRPTGDFDTDPRTASRVTHHDYTGSGYDRGHMVPNSAIARCFGPEAQRETFLMSNICPQAPNLNQKVWEDLERAEYADAVKYGEVWIMDGPVFADLSGGTTRTLRSGVAVPSAFYKILARLENRELVVLAVIMPQTARGTESPRQFATTVSEVEKQTGLEFFWKLSDAARRRIKETKGEW